MQPEEFRIQVDMISKQIKINGANKFAPGKWIAPSGPQSISGLGRLIPAQLPEERSGQLPLSHLKTKVTHNTNLTTCVVNKEFARVSWH